MSQKAFADNLKLNFPLLSDFPNLKTIQDFGVLIPERRLAQRAYFIVDKQGRIAWAHTYDIPQQPENEDLFAELRKRWTHAR